MTDRAAALRERIRGFMKEHVSPLEIQLKETRDARKDRWAAIEEFEPLKAKAREAGLWNLFLPGEEHGAGLTNVEYAHLCEEMGRSEIASEIFNCSAPDTGNMEVLAQYGSEAQKAQWLTPLLRGEIRSAFAMTEPAVASSDATNIATRIERDGDEYVIDGRKWWTSGVSHPRCTLMIVMGRSDPNDDAPRHQRHSMILVPKDTPGVTLVRTLTVFGYDHAPHGHAEVLFENVRVPVENMLLGEGRGFEIAQGRLGPGRIHHCMRAIGVAERALELTVARATHRVAFGKHLHEFQTVLHGIAQSRLEIDQARLLTLHAAHRMDTVGNKLARREIAMIKVVALNAVCQVLDRAIQVHGACGVSQDTFLAHAYALYRSLRMGDGPDEVHLTTVGKLEIRRQLAKMSSND